jgi:hypothetical protein
MDQNLKNMLKSASVQKIRELLEKHVDEIQINTKEKQVIIMIDKKYSLNQLC